MFTIIVLVCSLKSMYIPSFVSIGGYVSELHTHVCPYCPEAVYCCFTKTTCLYQQINMPILSGIRISISSQSVVSQLCPVL